MPKANLGQGCLCIVGILSLQTLLNWMVAAATKDLLVAFVIIMAAFAAWVAYRITRRRTK